MVFQKACREVKNISNKIEHMQASREESKDVEKLDKNIAKWTRKRDNKLEECKLIKTAEPFEITCQASLKSLEHWKKVLENADESRRNKALARIVSHGSIVKMVNDFKKCHTDWQLWLPELIELWIGKRKLKQNGQKANKKEFTTSKKKKKINSDSNKKIKGS